MENVNQIRQQQEMDAIVASIVGTSYSSEAIEVEVPSKGIGYVFTDGSNKVKVRPMTFADEKAILSSGKGNVDTINTLLNRCVVNTQISKLYSFDKLFLLLKIRELSYGDTYSATVHCPSCNKENKFEVKISSLAVNHIGADFSDPTEIILPVANKKVLFKNPRIEDEVYLGSFEKSATNLWRFIESIDGHTSSVIIGKVLEKLHLRDVNTLIKSILNPKYGIVPSVRMGCSECDKVSTMDLPISSDFFMGN